MGPGYAATSTTALAIATGQQIFATQSGLAYKNGMRCRASSNGTPTSYMEGWVTSYGGSALIMTVDLANGTGTYSDWNLNLSGIPGAGYAASSSTALSIALGSSSLTTGLGLAYSPGARVRISAQSAPTNWMEGIVTSYSNANGTLAFTADLIGGSGAFTVWTINIAGQPGVPAALTALVNELSARLKMVEVALRPA
jgi:hypothetical protein